MTPALAESAPLDLHHGPVRAVTFDVGGTLIEPWPSVGHIYAEVAAHHGWTGMSVEALDRQFAAAWRELKDFHHTRTEWADLVDAAFSGMIAIRPSRTFFPELYARFSEPDAWQVFNDVVPTLDALASRGVKLGVISNWDERLRPLLRRLKLHDYFEAVVVSCDVGFAKPSAVIFEQAAEKLGLPPAAVLHVGDSAEMDLRGARAAGMQAVGLRRGAAQGEAGQLKSLRELEHLLAGTAKPQDHMAKAPRDYGPQTAQPQPGQ